MLFFDDSYLMISTIWQMMITNIKLIYYNYWLFLRRLFSWIFYEKPWSLFFVGRLVRYWVFCPIFDQSPPEIDRIVEYWRYHNLICPPIFYLQFTIREYLSSVWYNILILFGGRVANILAQFLARQIQFSKSWNGPPLTTTSSSWTSVHGIDLEQLPAEIKFTLLRKNPRGV